MAAIKKTVMLIDDSDIDAFINQKMIQNVGFADKIYIHSSSFSAIDFFKNFERVPELPHTLLPSVIFLDLNMPNKDGFGFIDEFNNIDKRITENIKIIFVTSSTNIEDIERAKQYPNVLSFLNKPLTTEHLLQVQRLLD